MNDDDEYLADILPYLRVLANLSQSYLDCTHADTRSNFTARIARDLAISTGSTITTIRKWQVSAIRRAV